MMKIKLLFIVLLLPAATGAQSITPEQARVQHVIENLFAALTDGDTTNMKKLTTRNVRFYEYGEVWPMDTLINKIMKSKSIPDFKRTNQFEFVSTTLNKNTAWVSYYLQSTITRNGKSEILKWMETVVFIKDKQQWKIDVLHSTRLPRN